MIEYLTRGWTLYTIASAVLPIGVLLQHGLGPALVALGAALLLAAFLRLA